MQPTLLKLAKLCLHNTNFEFNVEHYMQIGGTSIRNPFAPSEANLFLGKLEEKVYNPLRYIDDYLIFRTDRHSLNRVFHFITQQFYPDQISI
jgi:hypothetical protein